MPNVSAVIIALNEEKNITDCLGSVAFCDEKVVVDSGSTDRTRELAEQAGAKVYSNEFKDYASQKNFGIRKTRGEWVLLLDADERVSPELAAEIKKTLEEPKAEGYFFPRSNRIFGRWMKHGMNGDDLQLRLAKKEKAVFEGVVHERIYLDGPSENLKNPLLHYSTDSLAVYMKKLNNYTSMEAGILKNKPEKISIQNMRSRPFLVFCYRVFWQRGILDGWEGFLYGVLSAYYEFVRLAKCWELEKGDS